jgi:hypothetical protein
MPFHGYCRYRLYEREKNVTYLNKGLQLSLGISKLMFYPKQCSRKPEPQNKQTKIRSEVYKTIKTLPNIEDTY